MLELTVSENFSGEVFRLEKQKEKVLIFYSWSDLWSMGKGRGSPDFSLSIEALAEAFEQVAIIYPAGGSNLDGLPKSIRRVPFGFSFENRLIDSSITGRQFILVKLIIFAINWLYTLAAHLCFSVSCLFKAMRLKKEYSLVACYGPRAITGARIYSWYNGLPLIVRLFGLALGTRGYGIVQRLLHFEETLALGCDAWGWIITNDGSRGDLAAQRFNIPDNRLFFPLCAVERPENKDDFSKSDFCIKYGIDPESRIVVRVSRLWVQQRIDRLIDCLPPLTANGKPVIALIVGDGPERERLEWRVREVGGKVIFAGAKNREELREIYLAADLYVATSDRTNLSNSVLEAFVYGVPVIALDKGGTSGLIKSGLNGFLVPDVTPELNSGRNPRGLLRGKRTNKNKTLLCNEDSPRLAAGSLQLLRSTILNVLSDSELHRRISAEAQSTAARMIPDFERRKLMEAQAFLAALGKDL